MSTSNLTSTEIAIMASIAAENVIKGFTLTPTEIEVMLAYVIKTDCLTAYQKRVWQAVLESHERLRVEKLLVRIL